MDKIEKTKLSSLTDKVEETKDEFKFSDGKKIISTTFTLAVVQPGNEGK